MVSREQVTFLRDTERGREADQKGDLAMKVLEKLPLLGEDKKQKRRAPAVVRTLAWCRDGAELLLLALIQLV